MVLSLLHVFLLIHFSPGYHLQHLCSNNREVGVKSIPAAVCKSCPVCFYRLIRVCINSCIKIVWFKRCSYSSFLDSKNKVMIFVGIFVFVLGFGFFLGKWVVVVSRNHTMITPENACTCFSVVILYSLHYVPWSYSSAVSRIDIGRTSV